MVQCARAETFVAEQRFLQREADRPVGWFALLVYALAVGLALAWIVSFTVAARRVSVRAQTDPEKEVLRGEV